MPPAAIAAFQAGPDQRALLTLPDGRRATPTRRLRRLASVPWSVLYAAPQREVDGRNGALAHGRRGRRRGAVPGRAAGAAHRPAAGEEIRGLGRDAARVALSEAPPPPRPPALVREVAEARASPACVAERLRQRAAGKRERGAPCAADARGGPPRQERALRRPVLVRLAPRDVPPEHFAATAEGRPAAMARAHALLADRAWEGAPLRELALGEFAAAAPPPCPAASRWKARPCCWRRWRCSRWPCCCTSWPPMPAAMAR
ncbi:HWE histidine kinase domain-containing protein [Pseudoroseomonas cervicalis]|uniref:HWE histidine kinase domain-containing protein n=1 Tax=Teichococcus cervicalis TaxID=204525 RepID=UPI0035E56EBD